MKNLLSIFIISCLAIGLLACNNKKEKTLQDEVADVVAEIEKLPETKSSSDKKMFKIESAYVKYNMKAAGQDMVREWWFDQYGKRQLEDSYLTIMGEKAGGMTLTADGYMYKWDYDATEGTRMKFYAPAATDYDDISKDDIERYGIEKHGYEEVAGKKCLKVTTKKPIESTVWVWENIPMKTISSFAGNEVVMEAVEIKTGKLDNVSFEIPQEITFTDYQ
jgi:hypothetical protein